MSILITGGAGYIGSHTTVELLNAGFDVVLADDFSNSSPAVLERLEKITGKKFPFYQGSILDTDFLDKVFTNEDIELVIHFAAFKAVGESVQKPLKYYKNNISGTITLLEKMKEYDVKNIVFSSSATVYGTNNPSPMTEDMPTSAINPYGYTKLMMERILTVNFLSLMSLVMIIRLRMVQVSVTTFTFLTWHQVTWLPSNII